MSRIISTVVTLSINLKVKEQHEFFYPRLYKSKGPFRGIKLFKNNIFKRVFLTFKEDESNVFMNNRCWGILPQFSLFIFDIYNLY